MGHFKYLEHTADMGVEARADSPEELARQAGIALAGLLYESPGESAQAVKPARATGGSAAETLVNWLNELHYLMSERQLVPVEIEVFDFTGTAIHAELRGEPFQPEKHTCLREIKAVTHHQTVVTRDDKGWLAQFYLDL